MELKKLAIARLMLSDCLGRLVYIDSFGPCTSETQYRIANVPDVLIVRSDRETKHLRLFYENIDDLQHPSTQQPNILHTFISLTDELDKDRCKQMFRTPLRF